MIFDAVVGLIAVDFIVMGLSVNVSAPSVFDLVVVAVFNCFIVT